MHTVLATLDGQLLLLAQDGASDGTATTEVPSTDTPAPEIEGGGGLFSGPMFYLIIGLMVLWIFMLGGGSRKQKKKQAEMIATMTKGAKVVTIGGIKGSIVEVRDDEVIVKVDENNNTRMKFSKEAIRTVVESSASKDVKDDQGEKNSKDEK